MKASDLAFSGIQHISVHSLGISQFADYKRLWEDRCDVGYNLIINAPEREKSLWSQLHADLFLFGIAKK